MLFISVILTLLGALRLRQRTAPATTGQAAVKEAVR